jgi:transcription-repair coupling factor (superfamily II helicase)
MYSLFESHLSHSPFFLHFGSLLTQSRDRILIHNLNQSAKALLAVDAFRRTNRNVLLVVADDRLADDFLDDLQLLAGRENAFQLPDFEVLPYEERSPHYTIRAQRIETLSRLIDEKPAIFVVSLRALMRNMVTRETFAANRVELKQGREYRPDVLVSDLIGMGYQHEFQVSRVGEVARRGGIVDIFPPNLDQPVRVEFWGDEIASMRSFFITSQRSVGKDILSLSCAPSREFSLAQVDTTPAMWERVHTGGFYEGIELDTSLLLPKTGSFAEWFPESTLLMVDEPIHASAYLKEIAEECAELWRKARTQQSSRVIPEPQKLFGDEIRFRRLFETFRTLFLAHTPQGLPFVEGTMEAPFTAQTVMHGDLAMLEQSVADKRTQDHVVFILSDNKSQSKRMQEMLPDLGATYLVGQLHKGFNLNDAGLSVFNDHEIFSRTKKKSHSARFSKEEALTDYESLQPGDYIVHITYGIGVFDGLAQMMVEGNRIECLTLQYADGDRVYVPTFQLQLVSRFVSEEGFVPVIHKLGGKKWEHAKSKARKQIETIAEDIVKLYAERKLRQGVSFPSDTVWQQEMEDSFMFEDTPDQHRASEEIKRDMEEHAPMERLLCGDVGFGKTEVAIRAAFKAVMGGYQVAVLVPTTLLAEQHYTTFRERLAQYPVNIAMFSRFRSPANLEKDAARLALGQVDIAIGTHRLLSKDMKFKRLGLLIVDEEHRFGVRHKERLRQLKSNVDTLYMSATPIPRTLNMALSKLKEMSLIQTSPKARLPVRTIVIPWDEEVIKDAIQREIDRGGQVFFVHNRVQTIDSVAGSLHRLMPRVAFQVAHGQMAEKQLEAVMVDFAHRKFDVLVTTAIIESGIDIPNANTIIVDRSDMFGLSQLYQIRGRVGRSDRRAYAYLIMPPKLTEDARHRLETLTEYDYLGAGYQIAMRDLEIRGAGNLLGTKQSGLINAIGFNYYNHLLQQAVDNIDNPENMWKEDEEPKVVSIESDFFFPPEYISDEKERLILYRRMVNFLEMKEFDELESELADRFGEVPAPARMALQYYRLRLLAKSPYLIAFQMRQGTIQLELNRSLLPSRDKLAALVARFDYPVRFETVGTMKVVFTLDKRPDPDRSEVMRKSMDILEYIRTWEEDTSLPDPQQRRV